MNRILQLGVPFFVALLAASPASAQVYKCVDANGKTVYLQSPCPPGASSKVLIRKPRDTEEAAEPKADAKAAGKAGAKAPLSAEEEFQKRQKEKQEAEQKASEQTADAKRRQEECRRAREEVAQYELGGRITRVDGKGERYFLDDAQIAQEKARAQALVAQACK